MFSRAKSLNKVESLQKRAFRFLYDNCNSSYESVLKLAGKSAMNVTRLRGLCIESFKTLNNINPAFMNEIFELRKSNTNRAVQNQYKLNLEVPIINQQSVPQTRFGSYLQKGKIFPFGKESIFPFRKNHPLSEDTKFKLSLCMLLLFVHRETFLLMTTIIF